ncbi:MAG: 2-vinyl bacteriochlorophyllide hydratase [Chlorobium limicola]|jgi:3-vinyl bacteriochlorophyllide hydratase|uniref:2-vinyl bacteriochlorophyllide hydratase n=1 Tax=Chlorobium limicola (strain DSM 245 / NBRC 103803 / 6330) TaxID=290315 RepID=B3ECC2_CHLL2|nr:2-vinyl bacteriochlorophyllide hydratase [Chlorobium limicola]ACD90197.1 2-vinyl bacteriochlorophyllide hydratase [Chlorobium limicola DSM 245]NTV19979.1 2-vinyl bacteriochlorophyllide hydratase [Chlorobium limicola]
MPRYTPEQLAKRNASVWTEIQILLAPVQFVIFLTGIGLNALYASNPASIDFFWISVAILFKTLFFVILFITGMFFEKDLFGKWVFSKEFFWEDVGSSVATFFHFLYFVLAWKGYPDGTLVIWATVAYSSYIINAVQYLVRIWLEKSHERKLKLQAEA